MNRPGATESDQTVDGGIIATLDRLHPRGVRHAVIDDAVYPQRRLVHRYAERFGKSVLDRGARGIDIETHPPAEERIDVQIAEDEIGVGDRRQSPAAAVAGRSRVGADAVGTDLDQT